jgi:hypothetical protein
VRIGAAMGCAIVLTAITSSACDRHGTDIAKDPTPRADATTVFDASADADAGGDAAGDVATDARSDAAGDARALPPIEIPPSHAPATLGAIRVPWNDRDALGRALADPFGRCYADALLRDPMLAGTLVVRFVAHTNGKVDAPAAGGETLRDPDLLDCVVGVLRRLEIDPPPPTTETFGASFAFRPY